uniref:cytochrome P450 26C1-like n=1 Tax=Panthera onca TaxID=9690 RepID=UPI0029536C48
IWALCSPAIGPGGLAARARCGRLSAARAVLQETAVELLFAAFLTTASASTSLVLLLLQHPAAVAKIRQELAAQGLGRACGCAPGAAGGGTGPRPDCGCEPDLSLAALGRLRYIDCVVKEVLRLLPPVSGGYRTALRTFELDVSARAAPHPAASCRGVDRAGSTGRGRGD